MLLGPFLRREMVTTSRWLATFVDRCVLAIFILAVLVSSGLAWDWAGFDRGSIGGMARFTRLTFAALVVIQGMIVLVVVTQAVASEIVREWDRKTLDALLSSGFSGGEVVLGLTAAGLFRLWSRLAVLFPVVILFVPLGGVDPRLVFLSYVGLAALSLAVAGISIAVSIGARGRRGAVAAAGAISLGWLFLPFFAVMLLPRVWTVGARWIAPVALVLLDSSPMGLVMNLVGLVRRGSALEVFWWMIGLETLGGTALILWAIARLRPACRALYDEEGRLLRLLGMRRARRGRWPACGDDPVLWRERHAVRESGYLARLAGELIHVAWLGSLALGTFWFAEPAFRELLASGYGRGSEGIAGQEFNPFAMAFVRGWSNRPPTGLARTEFNTVLRQVTSLFDMLYVLVLAGFAAEGVTAERERDTWSALILTGLSAREILRGKMLAAVWRARGLANLMIGLWLIGLLSGSLHPLGFVAALAGLALSTWLLAELGTLVSLRSRNRAEANNRFTLPLVFLVFSPAILIVLPPGSRSVLLGIGSMPFQTWLSLVSYEDVRAALHSGAFPQLAMLGSETGEGAGLVLAVCLISLAVQAVGALLATRAAFRRNELIQDS